LKASITNVVTGVVRASELERRSPSADEVESLRAAVVRYATDIAEYGNAVTANLQQAHADGQVSVVIRSEKSVERELKEIAVTHSAALAIAGASVARLGSVVGMLGSAYNIEGPTSGLNRLLCLDAPKVQELRDRVAAFVALGGQAAIPAKALFDAMLQTSTKLPTLPRRNQPESAEGLCVLANTMNALDTLMGSTTTRTISSAPVPVAAGRLAAAQATFWSQREIQTAISAASAEPTAISGRSAEPKKPVLWGLPDLFAPLCPFYPAC
jgi:hypothetical protein